MVNLYRLLMFFAVVVCVEVAANEWKVKVTERQHTHSVELKIVAFGSTVSFDCLVLPETVFSAKYDVGIPGTAALISSNMSADDAAEWRQRLDSASRMGEEVVALGNFPTPGEIMEGSWPPKLVVMVPVANFPDAWEEYESLCEKRQAIP